MGDSAPNPLPLHTQDPTTRFSDRAAAYVQHRPSYPTSAIDHILIPPAPSTRPGPAERWEGGVGGVSSPATSIESATRLLTIADIGAGTGISSRLLADRGHRVLAIEPNAAMRAAAEPHELVTAIDATAEDTTLPDASIDVIVCAQAFHWFRPREAVAEFARILRPGGRLALMWNVRDDSDPLTADLWAAICMAADRGEFAEVAE